MWSEEESVEYSNIIQVDGNISLSNYSSSTEFKTEDEIEPNNEPLSLEISETFKKHINGKISNTSQSSILPLCLVTNARSLYNKKKNFEKLMSEICPDIALISETWERKNFRLDQLLSVNPYKVLSYNRKERLGGGCAMFYNENRFRVKEEDDMSIPNGVEVK